MIKSIGMIELNSIAQGILVSDYILKAADTQLIFAKPVCPGKYIVLIAGDIGAVKTSIAVGITMGGNFVVDTFVIPSVHEQLIPAINAAVEIGRVNAVGVMEFFSIASAVAAADQAAKTADVRLMEVRLGMGVGGKSFVVLSGDVSAVEAAVNAGMAEAVEKGYAVSSCVIPSPSPELFYGLV
ncbi:MAG: BMC domain-containing protein [Clostridiales bacterium]|jgi:microcompartment protein CcmL/EutN|nr:BMC domain-containing protein [Clostridiales bacterium]